MGVGSVWTAADAEGVLDSGAALVAVGRAALTEPEWPNRIRQGQDIRTCVPAQGRRRIGHAAHAAVREDPRHAGLGAGL
ncbi:MAG: hypothetical protein R2873_18360 [Caldilineaceae bacterium]